MRIQDRTLPKEMRRKSVLFFIQLIRGMAWMGQDVILLYEVPKRPSTTMATSLPARVCIASKSIR